MNFHDYLNRQNAEDRRAFIIHYHAKSGKTQFAHRICAIRQDVYLLDLQAYFLKHPELTHIGQFNFENLQYLLLALNVPQSVIIVDNTDFLFNTWEKRDKTDFTDWLRQQLRSPGVTDKTFIFMVQSDPFFESLRITNSYQEPRVLPLNAFEAL